MFIKLWFLYSSTTVYYHISYSLVMAWLKERCWDPDCLTTDQRPTLFEKSFMRPARSKQCGIHWVYIIIIQVGVPHDMNILALPHIRHIFWGDASVDAARSSRVIHQKGMVPFRAFSLGVYPIRHSQIWLRGKPTPLKNMTTRQLGWWHSQDDGKVIIQMVETTNQSSTFWKKFTTTMVPWLYLPWNLHKSRLMIQSSPWNLHVSKWPVSHRQHGPLFGQVFGRPEVFDIPPLG